MDKSTKISQMARFFPKKSPIFFISLGKMTTFASNKTQKGEEMATYTVTINERTNAGRQLLNYLLGLGLIKERVSAKKKSGFEEAEEDIKAGRVYTASSAADLFNQLMKD